VCRPQKRLLASAIPNRRRIRTTITIGETTTEVTVSAYTTLGVEGIDFEVRGRGTRVTEAEVYWAFEEASWRIIFIQLRGAYLNKDGKDSRQRLDVTTHLEDGSGRAYRTVTPPEIVAGALSHTPDWTPEVSLIGPSQRSWRTLLPALRGSRKTPGGRAAARAAPADLPRLERAGSPSANVTHLETTTQVAVHAYTPLRLDDFTMRVKDRAARIKKAKIHWWFGDGSWVLEAVDVWGPVIRKSDGAESSRNVDELTRPAFASNAQYGVITPPEIVEVALQNVPDVEPRVTSSPYPRHATLRSSL